MSALNDRPRPGGGRTTFNLVAGDGVLLSDRSIAPSDLVAGARQRQPWALTKVSQRPVYLFLWRATNEM